MNSSETQPSLQCRQPHSSEPLRQGFPQNQRQQRILTAEEDCNLGLRYFQQGYQKMKLRSETEKKRADDAEKRADDAEKRADDERKRADDADTREKDNKERLRVVFNNM